MLFARSYFLGGEDPSLLPKLACIVPWYLDANVAVRSRVPAADDFVDDSDVEESCFLSFVEVCREDREDEEEEEFSLSGEVPGGLSFSIAFFIFVFETFGLRAGRETFFVVLFVVIIIVIISSSSSSYSSDCALDEELSLFVLSRIASNRTWSPRV
jgi:hypothetical protein